MTDSDVREAFLQMNKSISTKAQSITEQDNMEIVFREN